MLSRRRFLVGSSALALSAGSVSNGLAQVLQAGIYVMPEKLTKSLFANALRSSFQVEAEAFSRQELDLIELNDRSESAEYEQFSLIFRGSPDSLLPQKTYRFDHPEIGQFHLFIVPVGGDVAGHYYEAVFNRLVTDA